MQPNVILLKPILHENKTERKIVGLLKYVRRESLYMGLLKHGIQASSMKNT